MQNIFLPEKQMIVMPLNCNLMRHNLFFKVIYTRCVGGEKRRGRSLVFSLRVKLAGGHFHVYELHTWLLGAVETGDKKKKKKANLRCSPCVHRVIATDRDNNNNGNSLTT